MRNAFITVCCLAVFLVAAYSDEPVVIAVSTLQASGDVKVGESSSLTDALRAELVKTGSFNVMERTQMEEILREQGFQQSGACGDQACAVEMGRLLAVKCMVLGNIGKVGRTFALNVRQVDVETGRILNEVNEYHKGSVDLLLTDVVPIAARKLAGTYKKKNGVPLIVALSTVAVAAIAVPAVFVYRARRESGEQTTTDITVKWIP